jgi:hypothetical protein
MNVAAQIIIAIGVAVALILFAANGPLRTVLSRGTFKPAVVKLEPTRRWTRRDWVLLASGIGGAAVAIKELVESVL